ncbi:chloride channel protein [candidate division GN15 bacterium]|uniref:Chloride channel protein n=1 Tax=candidate division GN15 bacterium TaxID=2072418 RepID=A0A855X224_9BACT|nr:MAG: chloride channel protein [candidate division GN15 bacterium]
MNLAGLLRKLKVSGPQALLIIAAAVGLATAAGALAFRYMIGYFNHVFFGLTDQRLTQFFGSSFKFWLPLIPMAGGVLVGPIVYRFAKEARGHGVPEVMDAVARLGGIIRPRVAAAKAIASAICIGSGGSAGREGPIVQIGSALGSTLGQYLRLSEDRLKVLVGCGAAAGISSVFNAPIAGVMFSVEIILGDFTISTFSPVLVSSVVASVLTRSVLGNYPAFQVPGYSLVSPWEIPLYMVLGAVLGVVAVSFTKSLDILEDFFERLKVPDIMKPAVGGLLLGCAAMFFPQILADGYDTIRLSLNGEMVVWLLLILIPLKILATSLTLGSGNSGGIFAPSLFMGAMTGGAFGIAAGRIFPGTVISSGAYALVGMAGLVAGTTHAPMTALLIIFEMTNDYHIVLPLMVTVAVSSLVARLLLPNSIYTMKLVKKGIDIRSGRDVNVLKAHQARELADTGFEAIAMATPLPEILQRMASSRDTDLVVTDREGRLEGLISFQDIQRAMTSRDLDTLIVAYDLIHQDIETVEAGTDLDQVMNTFNVRGARMLPVIDSKNSRKVIGVLRKDDLTEFYNQKLLERARR